MGKTKQKKHKVPKPLPTGLPSVRDLEKEEAASGGLEAPGGAAHTVASVVDKLTSPSVEEREYACTAIAACVSQPEAIPTLLRLDAIRGLGPLIVDLSDNIRQSALGALRNISVDGGPNVCKKLVLKDVLTPLITLLNQYGVGWVPEHSQAKRKPDVKVEIYTQAVYLLANLCESTELALTVFNKENLGRFLVPCLNAQVYGYPLAVAVGQCLYSVSEDNCELADFLCQPDNRKTLENLAGCEKSTAGCLLLRTLAIGILCNGHSTAVSQATGAVIVAMVTKLTQVIVLDAVDKLKSAVLKVKIQRAQETAKKENGDSVNMGLGEGGADDEVADNGSNEQEMVGAEGDGQVCEKMEEDTVATGNKEAPPKQPTDLTVDIEEVQFLLTAQQVAFELLTNLCVAQDDGEDWEDMDSSSSSDDMVSLEDSTMADNQADNNNMFNALCLPSEVRSAFLSIELLDKVLTKAGFPELPAELEEMLDQDVWKSLVTSFTTVQSHALLCINNLATCLEAEALGGAAKLQKIWLGLVEIFSLPKGKENSSLLEAVTSAMRAVIQKFASLNPSKLLEVKDEQMQFVFTLGQKCEMPQVRANAVKIVSTIGCILATIEQPQPHPALKDIGMFLVGVACHDSDLWVTAEALDSIFDVFAEDHLDPIIKEMGMIEKLRKLDPALKSKMSSQRNQLGEHYPIIYTAKKNLGPFIKYKTARLAGGNE